MIGFEDTIWSAVRSAETCAGLSSAENLIDADGLSFAEESSSLFFSGVEAVGDDEAACFCAAKP